METGETKNFLLFFRKPTLRILKRIFFHDKLSNCLEEIIQISINFEENPNFENKYNISRGIEKIHLSIFYEPTNRKIFGEQKTRVKYPIPLLRSEY